MHKHLFAALLAATSCGSVSASPSNMQPGLWRITSETVMPGMPMAPPLQTMQHCYTAEELKQSQNTVPQSGNGNCKISDYQVKGNTATWSMECTGDTPMHGRGTMTTEATRYSGQMTMTMPGPSGSREMTTRWRAERIGDCR